VPIPSEQHQRQQRGRQSERSNSYNYRSDIGNRARGHALGQSGRVGQHVVTEDHGNQRVGPDLREHDATFSTRSPKYPGRGDERPDHRLGGLIKDKVNKIVKQVPLLGDVPLVGNLFKRTDTSKEKIELLIFLTPYVAQSPSLLTQISELEESRSTISQDKTAADAYRAHMESMKNMTGQTKTDPNQ
jgi:hypothetical protein